MFAEQTNAGNEFQANRRQDALITAWENLNITFPDCNTNIVRMYTLND